MKLIISTVLSLALLNPIWNSPDFLNKHFFANLKISPSQIFISRAQAAMDAKDLITVSLAAAALLGVGLIALKHKDKKPIRPYIILDTDMVEDPMDAGTLAVLHAFEKQGLIHILAVMTNSISPYSPNTVMAINQYYQRADIPIGSYKGDVGTTSNGKYNLPILSKYNTGVNRSTTKEAFELYRSLLEKAKDQSVTIVSIGFLTNLYELLKSPADEFSDLSGSELVTKKVKRLVIMGGKIPSGVEYNFSYQGVGPQAIYSITNWPTEIVFSPSNLGTTIFTDATKLSSDNPVKMAYINQGNLKNLAQDQIALLYAVRGASERFTVISTGYMHINEDASTIWKDDPDKNHSYLKLKQSNEIIAQEINQLMQYNPGN